MIAAGYADFLCPYICYFYDLFVGILIIFKSSIGKGFEKNIFLLSLNERIVGFEFRTDHRRKRLAVVGAHSAEKLAGEALAEGKSRKDEANGKHSRKDYDDFFVFLCH